MSLISAAPAFMVSLATLLLKVSTEIIISGKCCSNKLITGRLLLSSSSSEICCAPGLEE